MLLKPLQTLKRRSRAAVRVLILTALNGLSRIQRAVKRALAPGPVPAQKHKYQVIPGF